MSKEEFIKKIKDNSPQSLDGNYEGSCPCSWISVKIGRYKFDYTTRCWRISDNPQDLIISSKHPDKIELAEAIKKELDKQEWYNPYTIIYE